MLLFYIVCFVDYKNIFFEYSMILKKEKVVLNVILILLFCLIEKSLGRVFGYGNM